jgi:hypothetical protein
MLLRTGVLLAIALVCGACTEDRGPLPAVPTPQERAAAMAEAQAEAEWRSTTDGFFEAIRPTVGEAPVECNSDLRQKRLPHAGDAPPALLRAWFDCTRTAMAAGKSSIIVLSHPTIDSWVVGGTLVSGDGRAIVFVYDAVFGNAHYFMLGPCESPAPRTAGTGLYGVRCANERRDGEVPMSEQPLSPPPLPSTR